MKNMKKSKMAKEYDAFRLGIELVDQGKVKKVGRYWFEVTGTEEESYSVFFDSSKISCTCKHYALHGCRITKINDNGVQEGYTKGNLCKHIFAVIITEYKIRKILETPIK